MANNTFSQEVVLLDPRGQLVQIAFKDCNSWLEKVIPYLLSTEDSILEHANTQMIKELKKEIKKIFGQIQKVINYLPQELLERTVRYLQKDVEIIQQSNMAEEDKLEEMTEMLVDLPSTLNRMLNLEAVNYLCREQLRNNRKDINTTFKIIESKYDVGNDRLYTYETKEDVDKNISDMLKKFNYEDTLAIA